ncbi:cephalosporin hydroxylase family protein [Desulfoluna spongiiphila]|uniref:Cephalosporin hydroxylase n=1 Tax=Desulfoluna spongiiphila TaxID=419481 RepID=A0A1G5JFK5_9BACT|nr:cephalosporin hydroxylase family protein [Desulfoluna spongiiphila]SCY87077.1 Cephalosporin hydroxylase [Desulfoluna spongiiphila]
MNSISKFEAERKKRIHERVNNSELQQTSKAFLNETLKAEYSYGFSWMGRPIIQYPQDIMALQEIIWQVKPDLIIETGIAHGGSLIFSASMLELLGGDGEVLGLDIDIREHNRLEIEKHPMSKRITMLEGSSIDEEIVRQVVEFARGKKKVLVCLDSMHSHEHVAKELELYSPLVNQGSYLVVFDTIIEDMPVGSFPDRPWDKGNNPKTAVWEFLKHNDRFVIDEEIQNKLLITVAPDGYLKCIK